MTKSADIDAWTEARSQHGVLRRYLSGSIDGASAVASLISIADLGAIEAEMTNARPTARERLSFLTSKQLEELTHDACDVIRARLATGSEKGASDEPVGELCTDITNGQSL